jgi:hypothetical protein
MGVTSSIFHDYPWKSFGCCRISDEHGKESSYNETEFMVKPLGQIQKSKTGIKFLESFTLRNDPKDLDMDLVVEYNDEGETAKSQRSNHSSKSHSGKYSLINDNSTATDGTFSRSPSRRIALAGLNRMSSAVLLDSHRRRHDIKPAHYSFTRRTSSLRSKQSQNSGPIPALSPAAGLNERFKHAIESKASLRRVDSKLSDCSMQSSNDSSISFHRSFVDHSPMHACRRHDLFIDDVDDCIDSIHPIAHPWQASRK